MKETLLGLDIGSSSVKASLLSVEDGSCVASATSPEQELPIHAPSPGYAEQDPELWWQHTKNALQSLGDLSGVVSIGISYQMHGLVVFDKDLNVLRPAIIWCDSRATEIGRNAFESLGETYCLENLLNSPGNFTASKLAWIKENEPETFKKIWRIGLPGDYISFKLTQDLSTTRGGLSEGIFWDFKANKPSEKLLDYFGFPHEILPEHLPALAVHGTVSKEVSLETGLPKDTPVAFKAGDQPANAFALKALEPGDVAANAGTSAVLFAVGDTKKPDTQSRVNTFLHVNDTDAVQRQGTLLCINGAGILNSWAKNNFFKEQSYEDMNALAATTEPGASGLTILPYGNGAERSLGDLDLQASFHGLRLTEHFNSHITRAIQEGIVYSLAYGLEIMKSCDIEPRCVRAGHANMFLSPVFQEAFTNTLGVPLELYDTDGSQGAARGGAVGAGILEISDAFRGLNVIAKKEPEKKLQEQYLTSYSRWKQHLAKQQEGAHS